jgi:anti-sigma factor RsiW
MSAADYSDETLMRFADGELDEATAARLEEALAADDALVERLALFIETRAAAQAALTPLLEEPVPDALRASVEGMVARKRAERETEESKVVAFAPRPKRTASSNWMLPIAASLAAAVGVGAGYWLGNRPSVPAAQGISIAGVDAAALGAALENTASGSEVALAHPNGSVRPVATFRNGAEALCREFEIRQTAEAVVAVACHDRGSWNVTFALATPTDDSSYAPASSLDTLDAYLGALEASEPMSLAEEAAALGALKSGPTE